jgi:hypothetical protein
VRGRGRNNRPVITSTRAIGSSNRSGNRIARATISTAATDRGLRLAHAAGRLRVGRAIHRATITAPTRPQAPRHMTVDWLLAAPGKIQSSTAAVRSIRATTPTNSRRKPASEVSIAWIMAGPAVSGPTGDVLSAPRGIANRSSRNGLSELNLPILGRREKGGSPEWPLRP